MQEVREEAGRLMGTMADSQEAIASKLRSEMVGQAHQRADEMDGLVQEMSDLRWQAQGQVRESSASLEELRTRVSNLYF
jgi:methyl-accepting chemotaxis protein